MRCLTKQLQTGKVDPGSRFEGTVVCLGREGAVAGLGGHWAHVASELRKLMLSSFSPFCSVLDRTREMVPSSVRVGLPTSLNPVQELPHRYIQRSVSMVIPHPIK